MFLLFLVCSFPSSVGDRGSMRGHIERERDREVSEKRTEKVQRYIKAGGMGGIAGMGWMGWNELHLPHGRATSFRRSSSSLECTLGSSLTLPEKERKCM